LRALYSERQRKRGGITLEDIIVIMIELLLTGFIIAILSLAIGLLIGMTATWEEHRKLMEQKDQLTRHPWDSSFQ
jgi:hypothetical protein